MSDQLIFLTYLASVGVAVVVLAEFCWALFSRSSGNIPRRQVFVFVLQLSFVIAVWFAPWGAALGYFAASYDLRQGHFYIKRIGLMREPSLTYQRLLKDRYEIGSLSGAGCMPMPAQVDYADAYNTRSRAAILKHFGRDVFAECRRDAEAEWVAKVEIGNDF